MNNRINDALSHPDANWAYFHLMSTADKKEMDARLVALQHPLAFEPGTNEHRFKTLHKQGFRFPAQARLI